MQVIPNDTPASVASQLAALVKKHTFPDRDLAYDVYAVCHAAELPSFIPDDSLLSEISKEDPAYWAASADANERKIFLERLSKSQYMQALIALKDPMKATLTFMDHMKKAWEARVNSKAGSSHIDLHGDGESVFAGYASERELDRLQGRLRNEGLNFDQSLWEMTTFADAVEDEGMAAFLSGAAGVSDEEEKTSGRPQISSAGMGTAYTHKLSPSQVLAKAVVSHGLSLPTHYPILFEWYTKILEDLGVQKMKEVDTDDPSAKSRKGDLDTLDKLATADATEIAREDFDKRVADRSVVVQHHRQEEEGVAYLLVLLDVSGSMTCCDLGGRVSRAFAANVVTLALLNFAMQGKYHVWVIPFTGSVNPRQVQYAHDKATAVAAMKWLGMCTYNGSDTDIEGAVLWAYKEVKARPDYRKCDIVLITDGCSDISDRLKNEKPEKTMLRSILFTERHDYGAHMDRLIASSDSWARVTWDNTRQMFDIGQTLKGISDSQ